MTWETIVLLFLAGLSAGFIDAIAGGGGLISVPALLWAGLPPQVALGMAVRHGAPFIRIVFIAVVLAMVIKLLWDQTAVR